MAFVVFCMRALRGPSRYASALALALAACDGPEPSGNQSTTDAAVAVTSQALSEPPDSQCAVATFQGHEYWFCRQNKTWSAARTQCQSEGLDLARIDSAAENAFVFANLPIDAWLGASDQTVEGAWRWADNNAQFWSGAAGGSTVGGLYANWKSGQPDNFFNQDCGAMETFASGKWADRACTELLDFVCERALGAGEAEVDCNTDNGPEDAPWPGFRRCASHQATSGLVGAQDAEPYATFTTDDDVKSSPAIGADGTIYVGSSDHYLYAINPDLTLAWRFHTFGAVRSSPAIGADGTIYVGSSDGKLYAVNPDGTQKWNYLTLGAIWSSPAVGEDGKIYVGSDNTKFYAFSPPGAKLWDVDTDAFVRSTAAISPDGTIYIGYEDWHLVALNPDGSTKWTFNTLGPVTSSAAIGPDGTVYVGSFDGRLYAINPGNGSQKWAFTTSSPVTSSPAVAANGTIVFGDDSGRVRALNPNGTLKWSYLTGDDVISSPAIGSDGVVYVGSYDNNVYALDLDDGIVLWTLATGGDVFSSPAIGANGVVYVGSDDNKLYAIGPGCSPSNPCDNGEGPCGVGADCAPGLACGYGLAERYGLPSHFGVCWNPVVCATLHPTDCDDPGAVCGDCCVPACGTAAGGNDGCGGTCQACVAGADSDDDGILDCDERSDGDAWTDPLVFNGVVAQRGSTCHATPSCALLDTSTEIHACFTSVEENVLSSGWDFATSAQNICDPGFDFDRPWQGCGEDFAVRYVGAIKLEESGLHCFGVTGSVSSQCGALFLSGSSHALVTGGGATCFELQAGTYPIEWFYETTSAGVNELHVDYCFGEASSCTPSQAIPPENLRPAADRDTRVCAADAPCSELCPCGTGRVVDEDTDCAVGLVRRTDVADLFGLPAGTGVCWDPACDDMSSELFECGTTTARCGLCPTCTPNCAGKSCGYDGCFGRCGAECGDGEAGCLTHDDCEDGLECVVSESGLNVCRPAICNHPSLSLCADPENAGEETECGVCPTCDPDCTDKQCGDDGCGGACGFPGPNEFCSPDGHIVGILGDAFTTPTPPIDGPTTPGTLPGDVQVSDFGQAMYSIPLQLPPGRNGIEPNLALTYNSAAGNGYLGMGWGLSGLSAIQRCPKTIAQDDEADAVRYTNEDRFCLDGNRLVLEDESDEYGADGTKYRTEVETFSRIVSEGTGDEPTRFKVRTRDGRIMTYGKRVSGNTPLSGNGVRPPDYVEEDSESIRTHTWALTKVEDRLGNAMRIAYFTPEPCDSSVSLIDAVICPAIIGGTVREYYPKEISYTSHAGVEADRVVAFDYRPRRDALTGYQYGVRSERTQLLERITASVQGKTMFLYEFGYEEPDLDFLGLVPSSEIHKRTLFTSVRQCARNTIDADAPFSPTCKPPTVFEYEDVEPSLEGVEPDPEIGLPHVDDVDADFMGAPITLDLDGNGQDDVLYSTCSRFDRGLCVELDWGLSLNGQPPDDDQVEDRERMVVSGHRGLVPAAVFVMDYDRDGRDDLLEIDAAYRVGGDDGSVVRLWTFKRTDPEVDNSKLRVEPLGTSVGEALIDGNVHVVDADGDSISDLVVCKQGVGAQRNQATWRLHLHDGESGFGAAQTLTTAGPRCTAASAIDINGDGRQELMLNAMAGHWIGGTGRTEYAGGGEPWIPEQPSGVLWPLSGEFTTSVIPARRGGSIRLLLDANGDGLQDAVDFGSSHNVKVWLNSGTGFVSHVEHGLDLSRGTSDPPYGGEEFMRELGRFGTAFDENGDGRTDLLVRVRDDRWAVLRSLGTSYVVEALPAGLSIAPGNHLAIYDSNHDGVKDVHEQHQLWHGRGVPTQRLNAVTNGLGARTDVLYANLAQDPDELSPLSVYSGGLTIEGQCSYPCYPRRPTGTVVRQVRLWDQPYEGDTDPEPGPQPTPPTRWFTYSYANGGIDLHGRGSLGFGLRFTTDQARADLADESGGTQLLLQFYQNSVFDPALRTYPFVGMVTTRAEAVTTATGRFRTDVISREPLASHPIPRTVFAHFESEAHTVTEASDTSNAGAETLKEVLHTWDYDDFGNVELFTRFYNASDTSSVQTEYVDDQDHLDEWLISMPRRREIMSFRDGLTAQRVQQFTYAEESDPPGPEHMQFTGLPESFIAEPNDSDEELVTSLAWSEFGQVEEVALTGMTVDGLDTRSHVVVYDDFHVMPIRVIDDNGHETELKYDQGLGMLIGTSEFGHVSTTVTRAAIPDGFGRIRQVHDADGTFTAIEYEIESDGMSVSTSRTGFPGQSVRYDVLGREASRAIDGFDGSLRVETEYDAMGLVERVSRARMELGSPDADFTQFTYDALGRPLLTELPDGNVIERCYRNSVACARNPRGFTSCQVFNQTDALAHSIDARDSDTRDCDEVAEDVAADFPAEGAPAASTDFSASSYLYGPFGALRWITDPAGNVTTFERDNFARVRERHDANTGNWRYRYNAFGELQTQTDSMAQKSVFRYDGLGRLSSRTDVEVGAPDDAPGEVTTWLWDYLFTAGFYGELLATITPDGVSTTMTYDSSGRLSTFARVIPGEAGNETLSRQHDYDASGRLRLVTYESATESELPLRLRYRYNERGFLNRVSRPDPNAPALESQDSMYWEALGTDPYGQLAFERLGGPTDPLVTAYTYKPDTGAVDLLLTVQSGTGTVVQSWTHTYDANGNLETRTNELEDDAITTYGYDALDRLLSATTTDAGGATTLFEEVYDYDAIGNIMSKSVSDPSPSLSFTRSYDYDDGTSDQPHGVKTIDDGADTQQYSYDNSGNLTQRLGGLQSGLTIDYNRLHLPSHIDRVGFTTEVFLDYDADGMRVRKSGTTSLTPETFYLDEFYSRSRASGTSGYVERLVVSNGTRSVAEVVREPDATETTRYLHQDHLGSVEVVTDLASAELVLERRQYEAFGKRRAITGEAPFGTIGDYTDHEFDAEFDLINMKARLYDPDIGRFLAADPVLTAPGWSQGLNPYTYVDNNPMNWVDPLGLQAGPVDCGEDPDGCRPWYEKLWCSIFGCGGGPPQRGESTATPLVGPGAGDTGEVLAETTNRGIAAAVAAENDGTSGGSLSTSGSGYSPTPGPSQWVTPEGGLSIALSPQSAVPHPALRLLQVRTPPGIGMSVTVSTAVGGALVVTVATLALVPLEEAAVVGAVTYRAITVARVAINGARAVRIGQAGERAVRAAYDIGSKVKIAVNGRNRIPDGLTNSVLTEVKNVKSLSFTQQLRDFANYAQQTNRRFDLYVRPNTQLSAGLQDAVQRGIVNLRYIP